MLPANGRQHRGCIIPQAVTHSLVLLKMGKIIARNMLSWLELLISPIVASSWLSILFILMMHGQANITYWNTVYLLIKYIKSVLWRVAKYLSYIEEARCLKVNYAIHGACLWMVLLTDVYRNLTSLWIKPRERAFKQLKSPVLNVLTSQVYLKIPYLTHTALFPQSERKYFVHV